MNFFSILNHAIIFFLAIVFLKFENSMSQNLNNEKSDRVLFSLKTPIWFAEGTREFNNKVEYIPVDSRSLHDAIKFYENFENMAGIDIEKDNRNNWHFTRHIDKSNNSRKIPENLREIWLELFGGLHNNFTLFKNMKNSKNVKRSTEKSHSTDSTRRVKYVLPVYDGPDPIYPRILLFVNFKDYYTTDRDVRFYQLLIYLIAFWNSVDLEYTEFEFPLIKLHIAGIVIGNNKWANPLLYTSSQCESQSAKYNEAWTNFRNYLIHNDPLPGLWDIPISQSNVQLYYTTDGRHGKVHQIGGLARIGSACNFSPKSSRKDSALLVIDNLLFKGILSATHEIGHIFGAKHDGSSGALCDDYQFAMTPKSAYNLSSVETWSWCSKFVILKQLRNNAKVCWNFAPSIDKINQVLEILPGHLVSLKNQCINRGYDDICDEHLIKCNGLYCKRNLLGFDILKDCKYAGPPLAGSYCGNDKHCINKNCVSYV